MDLQDKKTFEAGEVIMRQGERGMSAYIIEEGHVEILFRDPEGTVRTLGTRGPGALIGEMAIVDNAPRMATIKAIEKCKLLEITQEDYAQRLKSTDPIVQMVSQVILTRYRDVLKRAEFLNTHDTYPPPESREQVFNTRSEAVESIKILNELKEALLNDTLSLNYQPIVDLGTGKISGMEALVRWNHPDLGFISPSVFIPLAEQSGMIVDVSRWVLHNSAMGLKRIQSQVADPQDLYVSVNFSSSDFSDENFVANVFSMIRASGLAPSQIVLEITERLLIQQPDKAKRALETCRSKGVRIAIDDFGTGYSSLSYLYYFPIDILKIDQSFIRTIRNDPRSLELVRSIIGLGKNLDFRIIAEGVEELEEARLLKQAGCDSVQGYHFSRPLPEEAVISLLQNWRPENI